MASHLDLEEQEQLDRLKSFWKQYGNLVTWLLVVVLGGYAAWTQWQSWQRRQGEQAGSMFDELERAVQAGDADAGSRIFADMKERFPRTAFAQQAGLIAARLEADKGKADVARASLAWVAEGSAEPEFRNVARLRLAGLLLDDKKYDDALKQLDGVTGTEFGALADDRRGDILVLQGKADDGRAAWLKAWQGMDARLDFRRLVEAKLNAVGVQPELAAGASAGAGAASRVEAARPSAATSAAEASK